MKQPNPLHNLPVTAGEAEVLKQIGKILGTGIQSTPAHKDRAAAMPLLDPAAMKALVDAQAALTKEVEALTGRPVVKPKAKSRDVYIQHIHIKDLTR